MSIAAFSLAEPAIAQATRHLIVKKPPPKRFAVALADSRVVPEPR